MALELAQQLTQITTLLMSSQSTLIRINRLARMSFEVDMCISEADAEMAYHAMGS